jgi:hypothetical protein
MENLKRLHGNYDPVLGTEMYVVKFDKEKFLWQVTIFEKIWSEEILSHEIKEIKTKSFIFHHRGYRWLEKEICRSLFYKHRLEIING